MLCARQKLSKNLLNHLITFRATFKALLTSLPFRLPTVIESRSFNTSWSSLAFFFYFLVGWPANKRPPSSNWSHTRNWSVEFFFSLILITSAIIVTQHMPGSKAGSAKKIQNSSSDRSSAFLYWFLSWRAPATNKSSKWFICFITCTALRKTSQTIT